MVQILLVLVTMVGFGIQKHIKNIFGVSQNDSKMFSQRFWDIKDKIIFWWKKFFFKNFSSPKKIQNSQDLHKITKKCQSRQLWAVLERQIIIFWACKSSYRVQEVKLDLRLATCVMKRNTSSWKYKKFTVWQIRVYLPGSGGSKYIIAPPRILKTDHTFNVFGRLGPSKYVKSIPKYYWSV